MLSNSIRKDEVYPYNFGG